MLIKGLVAGLIAIFTFTCVVEAKTTIEEVSDEYQKIKDNPLMKEFIGGISASNEGFTYIHSKETVRQLIPYNRACDSLLDEGGAEIKMFIRIGAEDEAKGLALSSHTGIFEIVSKYPLERFTDYIGSKAIFFAQPSIKTKEFLKDYDPLEYFPEMKVKDRTNVIAMLFKNVYGNSEQALKTSFTCFTWLAFSAVIGYENQISHQFERFEQQIRKANIQSLHKDFKDTINE